MLSIKKLLVTIVSAIMLSTNISNVVSSSILSKQQEYNTLNSQLLTYGSKAVINKDFNINSLAKLPQPVIDNLYRNKYSIQLQKNLIQVDATTCKVSLAQGTCCTATSQIAVASTKFHTYDCSKLQYMLYNNDTTLLHEVGHSWDYKGRFSNDKTWTNTYKELSNLFNTGIFKTVPQSYLSYYCKYTDEAYAECFALYFQSNASNKLLKQYCPKIYDYIDFTVNNYTK